MNSASSPATLMFCSRRLLCLAACVALAYAPTRAHDADTDPILAELNDYLMAVQVLRLREPRAAALFNQWEPLREGSWKIRDMTEQQGLRVDAPAVQQQIAATRALRMQLRDDCRAYFASLEKTVPTVYFSIGSGGVKATWPDAIVQTRVRRRDIVLVKVANDTTTRVHAEMSSRASVTATPSFAATRGTAGDQILFWRKTLVLEPGAYRYTFAYLAFSKPGPASAIVSLKAEPGAGEVRIRAVGTLPADKTVTILPLTSTRVALPGEAPTAGDPQPFSRSFMRFRVRDAETGKPLGARVEVTDKQGRFYWTPLRGPSYAVGRERVGGRTTLWEFQPGPYFYIDAAAELGVAPQGKTARFYHGPEYLPADVVVPASGVVDVRLKRWINMRQRGWYSGQTHIHTTDAGMPVQFSEFWPLVSQAEDLGVSYILTLKGEWTTHAIYADEFPMGRVAMASTAEHLIAYGQEYRNNPYGHLAFIGLDRLIEPISSGAVGELAGPDYPPNAHALDAAMALGATTIGAHFGNSILTERPIVTRWPSTGFELPVDVALHKIHLAEVYGAGGQQNVWYKLLNCGFNVPATAGPDWQIKDSPRAYVHLGAKPFTIENWTEGLRKGESFVTRGPMIFLRVDGAGPGARLHYAGKPQVVHVKAQALAPKGSQPVEIIVNGQVLATGSDIAQDITLHESAWVAARTEGAHTNPVYVTLQGAARTSAADARDFVAVTDRLLQWVEQKGLFDTPEQKQAVLTVLRDGRQVFQRMANGER